MKRKIVTTRYWSIEGILVNEKDKGSNPREQKGASLSIHWGVGFSVNPFKESKKLWRW